MAEKNYGTPEVVKEAVLGRIRGIYQDLRGLAGKLNISLPSIEAGKMPEYQQALDAIERYELALQNRLNLNKKMISKDGYDLCVSCDTKTIYKTERDIDTREHYVEGAGQLCDNCYETLGAKRK